MCQHFEPAAEMNSALSQGVLLENVSLVDQYCVTWVVHLQPTSPAADNDNQEFPNSLLERLEHRKN